MIYKITLIYTLCLLAIAAYNDYKYRRVPNFLTLPAMITGLVLCGLSNPIEAIYRIGFFFLLLFIGYFRVMGMGDLKLCMAVLCLRGVHEAWTMFFFGILILFLYCLVTEPQKTTASLKDVFYMLFYHTKMIKRSNKKYPFAVALAIGYLFTFLKIL